MKALSGWPGYDWLRWGCTREESGGSDLLLLILLLWLLLLPLLVVLFESGLVLVYLTFEVVLLLVL